MEEKNKKELKFEGTDVDINREIAFVKITERGNSQQTTVDTEKLAKICKFLYDLRNLGFEDVTLTVENGKPLIIGGKTIGIGIAPSKIEE